MKEQFVYLAPEAARMMAGINAILIATVFCLSVIPRVCSHGSMMTPPQRSVMYKYGFDVPANYDYTGLNCGGKGNQCAVCGDKASGPKLNEPPGKYATGTIAATYKEGEPIPVTIWFSANHKGFMEFRLCEHNDPSTTVTQMCLDENLLTIEEHGTRFKVMPGIEWIDVSVHLPAGVTCDYCVLQWYYRAGNSWGTDPDGTGCVGCGEQEEFVNCADIRIKRDAESDDVHKENLDQSQTGTGTGGSNDSGSHNTGTGKSKDSASSNTGTGGSYDSGSSNGGTQGSYDSGSSNNEGAGSSDKTGSQGNIDNLKPSFLHNEVNLDKSQTGGYGTGTGTGGSYDSGSSHTGTGGSDDSASSNTGTGGSYASGKSNGGTQGSYDSGNSNNEGAGSSDNTGSQGTIDNFNPSRPPICGVGEERICHCQARKQVQLKVCFGVGMFAGGGFDTWCENNCDNGYCPRDFCQCRYVNREFHPDRITVRTDIVKKFISLYKK